ncbi:putative snare protein [Xylaria arbuscula]|nr:putative snare protein [Xylaria arbuscula]
MKVYYIGVLRVASNESENDKQYAFDIATEKNLRDFGFLSRTPVSEFMTTFAKVVAAGTRPGQRQDVEQQDNTFHAYARTEGVCGVIITDYEYPALVAHQLLSKVTDEFLTAHPSSTWKAANPTSDTFSETVTMPQSVDMPQLKEYIVKYQDPHQADSIMKIQKELDETKIVLHKTIESVLQRGEKIDDLVEKSNDLGAQSRIFYKNAKKQNSCCSVM